MTYIKTVDGTYATTKPGKYKTRGGRDAVVLAVDLPVDYGTMIGYVVTHGDIGYGHKKWSRANAMSWDINGRSSCLGENYDDLVLYIGE